MSSQREPIEPTDVYDSTRRTRTEQVKQAAGRVRDTRDRLGRAVSDGARASGGAVDWTESKVNAALAGLSHVIDDAVRSGRVERVFDFAQRGVSGGARTARRILRRR